MEIIDSFKVDHTKLKRGLYISRKDTTPSGDVFTTFDIRMKEPNKEPALDSQVAHTIEHLAATYLRNLEDWKDKVVYWGPMGCLTGHYLIVIGDYEPKDVLEVLRDMFKFIAEYEGDIPGATPAECGNYQWNNLRGAKREAKKYLTEVLQDPPMVYTDKIAD